MSLLSDHGVSLRTVLFHEIADAGSTFTDGLGVRMPVETFRSRISFLKKFYNVVAGDDVRAAAAGATLPRRALLLTFDDAYASVATVAAEILDDAGLPSIFFVNSAFVDHQQLGTDNLVAHVGNTAGAAALQRAVTQAVPSADTTLAPNTAAADAISIVLRELVPTLPLGQVDQLRASLTNQLDHDPVALASEAPLYMSTDQLAGLPDAIEIGSHTASHVRCRMLEPEDMVREIDGNRQSLQTSVSASVGSFSVPYGSAADLTPSVGDAVQAAGHDLTFLVEGRLNHGRLDPNRLLRVSLHAPTNWRAPVEIEILPRLRYVRDLVKGAK